MSKELLTEIETFLASTRMGPTYFGKIAVGNAELVARLRGGGDVHSKTLARARTFMAQYYTDHPDIAPKSEPVSAHSSPN